MNKAAKKFIQGFCFTAILLLLLVILSLFFAPKSNTKSAGMMNNRAYGIMGEPENTIDVVFLGDSETYCAFVPLKIWEKSGVTSYVCGTTKQKLCYSYEMLETAFENQKPKIVILETNAIFRAFDEEDVYSNWMEKSLPVFRYHDRWKSLKKSDFGFNPDYDETQVGKGYLYNITSNPGSIEGYMKEDTGKKEINEINKEYVKKIKEYCDENGAELVLLSSPSTKNWNWKKHNSIQELAAGLGISYVDMNLMSEDIKIDWSTDTRDKGDHLNYNGAVKVSEYLGTYFTGMGMFEDKRENPDYEQWNKDLKYFEENKKPEKY